MYVGDELSGKRVYGDAPPLPVNQAEFSKFNSKYRGKKMTVLKFSSRGGFREATFLIEGNGKYLAYTSSCGKLWRRSYVPFANMTHLQPGQHAANFQPCIEEFRPANRLSFSIYFKGLVERNSSSDKESVLSIICQDQEQYDRFYGMVRGVMENIAFKKSLMNQHALYLEKMWDDADKHGTGKLSLYQIGGMCAKMNIDLPAASIKRKFDETDIDGSTFIEKDEFPFFIDSLCYRSDLQYIWEAIMRLAPEHDVQIDRLDAAGNPIFGAFLLPDSRVTGSSVGSAHTNGGKMSLQRFHQFLLNIQHEVGPSGEPITLEEARELVYDVMKIMGTQARGYVFDGNNLPYEVFRDYLSCSTLNEALNPQHGSVFQDMTQPLSAYFIASSHNTYLEGDQWRSSSSTQRYISDLLSCCRCVELDCWDGSNGEPIITHGHTATGVISFRDAIIAINEYAFRESPYPVVLSIEQHCSEIQIEMQVRIMKEIFEEKILIATAPGTLENLPSPAELRHKIIIKGKRGAIEENNDEDNDEEQEALAALQKVEKKSTDDLLKNLHWSHISNRLFEHHSRESRLSIMPTSLSPSVTGGSNGSGGDSPLMPPPPPLDSFRLIRTPHSLSGAVKQALAVKSKSEKKKLLSVTDKHDSVNSASSADSSSSRSANAGSAHSSSKREGRHAPVHAAIQTDTMSPITFLGTTSKVSKFALASMALPCDLMSSYSETTAQAYVDDATKLQGWIEHNTNHLSRIYPKGIRVDSSNYMPTTAWGAGAQLVALNYQTSDGKCSTSLFPFP